MKRIAISVAILQLLGAPATAQTAEEMVVLVSAHMTRANGTEDPPGMFLGTGPLNTTTTGSGRFSIGRCGASSLQAKADGPFDAGIITGWRVEIFPIRVHDGAATFRLKWIRAIDGGKDSKEKHEDIELTLRPGESRPMDSAAIPVDKQTGRRCPVWDNHGKQVEYSNVALRVSVDYRPAQYQERRLMGADLWLIERLPGGAERTQSLNVRGLPHRPIPFYFDAIRDQAVSLDIFGSLIIRPGSDAFSVEVDANSRYGPASFDWRERKSNPIRASESRMRVSPGETVELALGKLDDSAQPFTSRRYAIRIQVQQLR